MRIRPMTRDDLPRVVAAWNAILVHTQLTEKHFGAVTLGDPNYEPEGVLVAETDDGELVGFSACVVRRTVPGKDGGGGEHNFDRCFLKGFFVAGGDSGELAAKELLARAEAFGASAGKSQVVVTMYDGPYIYPGIDVRYERLRALIMQHGYHDFETIEDVAVNLRSAEVEQMLAEARATVPPEVKLATWEPGMLPAMRAFVEEGEMPGWFPIGWESGYTRARETTLVLIREEEIFGWAQFHPRPPSAAFGPILVLPRARGRSYGGLLLLESMLRCARAGCERMTAGWANTGFYVRYGWDIICRYAVLRKTLK